MHALPTTFKPIENIQETTKSDVMRQGKKLVNFEPGELNFFKNKET